MFRVLFEFRAWNPARNESQYGKVLYPKISRDSRIQGTFNSFLSHYYIVTIEIINLNPVDDVDDHCNEDSGCTDQASILRHEIK